MKIFIVLEIQVAKQVVRETVMDVDVALMNSEFFLAWKDSLIVVVVVVVANS